MGIYADGIMRPFSWSYRGRTHCDGRKERVEDQSILWLEK